MGRRVGRLGLGWLSEERIQFSPHCRDISLAFWGSCAALGISSGVAAAAAGNPILVCQAIWLLRMWSVAALIHRTSWVDLE